MNDADHGVDAALATLRTMVAIADATVERATESLTLTQFHALRVVGERTPVTMSRVAEELAMNPSTVTRACERLTSLDLLQKAQNPLNRRETLLAPTGKGRQLIERVDEHRRRALSAVLDRLDGDVRASVTTAFADFARAAAVGDSTRHLLAYDK
ncbi:MarR family transcriptional regulator [Amycolatopsis mongoliensis]|uniref:MarR family transcriptional regulator n=1 Tax=Amycolatopsis mongoliensis TaxID=715475 RepID=A0A9Y2K1A2_9PSEU|nr:MarR family transcriptional regulator [Amycolatopsis sp. 4-36]WIY07494.1 MarR family transcriptional regulator [Amycolatopsis sp. 4-36]